MRGVVQNAPPMYVLVRAEILAEITFWTAGILIWTGFFLLGKKLDYDTPPESSRQGVRFNRGVWALYSHS